MRDNISFILISISRVSCLQDAIEESAVSFDMSDLGLLVSFVKTVIRPKAKAIGLLNTEIDILGAKIVRAWLATVPDDGDGEMGEVIVKVVEGGGCEEVAIVEGLLCPHETTFDREFPDIEGIECTFDLIVLLENEAYHDLLQAQ